MVYQSAQTAIIKNQESGLVLDGSGYEVKLQTFTGYPSPSQLWILEPVGNGAFFIKNGSTGDVLDIEGGAEIGANIIMYEKHGGENQQWFIHPDNTIVCAAGNLALDVPESDFTPGIILIAYPKHGGGNQYFEIQYQ